MSEKEKQFEVTFHLSNGEEIGHLMKSRSMKALRYKLVNDIKENFELTLGNDFVLLTSHIVYFLIDEKE
jgi:hypothetical protein